MTFDLSSILICILVIVFAAFCLVSRKSLTAIIFFICFGLLTSICWVMLGAIDVAIAEAIIGAGITSVISLTALKNLETQSGEQMSSPTDTLKTWQWLLPLIVGLALCTTLVLTILPTFNQTDGLYQLSQQHLSASGVSNAVTAVLVNYRSYDTLLEMAVLVFALVAVKSFGGHGSHNVYSDTYGAPHYFDSPLLRALVTMIVPFAVIVAGYLLWIGSTQPGGAFQAGALLASAGLMLRLTREHVHELLSGSVTQWLAVIGWLVFFGVGLLHLHWRGQYLYFHPEQAGSWILLIEFFATLSIAVVLFQLIDEHLYENIGES